MRRVKEKIERSLGMKLFVKPNRCSSHKCVTVRRPQRPGVHGKARRTLSDYGRQLQEKQKLAALYGLRNRELDRLFRYSKERVMQELEHRLDHIVFLLGFASSQRVGRHLVSHGHILVNGRKVTFPSYRVTPGDTIEINPRSRNSKFFEGIQEKLEKQTLPSWLAIFPGEFKGVCNGVYNLDEGQTPFDIDRVVQFYAR